MDVAILTACFGGHDEVRTQAEQDIEVGWVCLTDGEAPEPWEVRYLKPIGHPNLQAKRFKCCPPLPHRYVIWIDANMEITSSSFAQEAIAHIHDGLALYRHPRRDCIYDEAEASLGVESQNGKYAGLPIREQVAHYREKGHPEHGGLYACGTIAWDTHKASNAAVGALWFDECERWTYQDQLSFPVICRRLGIEPGVFPFPQIERRRPVLSNRWLKIHDHL